MSAVNENLFVGSVWEHQTHLNLYVLIGFARYKTVKSVRLIRLGYDNSNMEQTIPLSEFTKTKFVKIPAGHLKDALRLAENYEPTEAEQGLIPIPEGYAES